MTKKVLLAVTVFGSVFAFWYFIQNFDMQTWDFRNNLWAPAYLLIHGESPYHIQQLYSDGSTAIWFPQIIGAFFPLGFLSLSQASNVWIIVNALTLIGMTTLLTRRINPHTTGIIYGVTLLGVLVFPPTITNIMLGQIDFLLIAAMLLAAWRIQKQEAATAGLGLALAISKPQLGFIVLPSAFLMVILKKRWIYGLKLLGYLLVFLLALTIPLWIANRNWLPDFLHNLQNNPGWLQPSPFSLWQYQFGKSGLWMWIGIAIFCMAVSIFLWTRLAPPQAVLWSLALTTIAAPYIWSWDFTLLLPLFIDTATRLTKGYPRLVLGLAWIACFFFFIWSRQFTESDHRLWCLPIILLVGIAVSLWLEYRSNQDSPLLDVYTHPTPLATK